MKAIDRKMRTERARLGFREHAETAFEFLRKEFGYRLVAADETFLRYESDRVFVNVYHGRSSFSVQYEIGYLASPESMYNPEEVAALRGSTDETFFQASTPERVEYYLPRLADILRRHGAKLLAADDAEFARLQDVRSKISDAVTRGYYLSSMRELAGLAWRRRDYATLVELLNAIGDDMTPVEKRKLQYAMARVQPVH